MGKKLRRGFKAGAERLSERLRLELGKNPIDPLSAQELASKLDIHILGIQDIGLASDHVAKIKKSPYSFSAFTSANFQGKKIIVHNEFHSPGRQQSNLMHEMAHILCEHPLPEPKKINGFPFLMRDYNSDYEAEAEAMGGILQITRKGLLWGLDKGMSEEELAVHFTATKKMVKFRLDKSGVRQQFYNRKRYYYN